MLVLYVSDVGASVGGFQLMVNMIHLKIFVSTGLNALKVMILPKPVWLNG